MSDPTPEPKREPCEPPKLVQLTPLEGAQQYVAIPCVLTPAILQQIGEEAAEVGLPPAEFIRQKLSRPIYPKLRYALEASQNPSAN